MDMVELFRDADRYLLFLAYGMDLFLRKGDPIKYRLWNKAPFSVTMAVHTTNLGMKEIWNAKILILEISSNTCNLKRTVCKPHSKTKSQFLF